MIFRSEAAREEYEFNMEANRLLDGGGCWIAHSSGNCLWKNHDPSDRYHKGCESCPAYISFYQVAESYQSNPGIQWSEAVWLANQFFDIKSTYMCNGEDGEWIKEHDPVLYKQLLKRQERLMDGHFAKENLYESEEKIQKPEIQGQMTIADWFREAEE